MLSRLFFVLFRCFTILLIFLVLWTILTRFSWPVSRLVLVADHDFLGGLLVRTWRLWLLLKVVNHLRLVWSGEVQLWLKLQHGAPDFFCWDTLVGWRHGSSFRLYPPCCERGNLLLSIQPVCALCRHFVHHVYGFIKPALAINVEKRGKTAWSQIKRLCQSLNFSSTYVRMYCTSNHLFLPFLV